jgi:hypothetical protein
LDLSGTGVSRSDDATFQPQLHDFRHTFAVGAGLYALGIACLAASGFPMKVDAATV